MIQPSLLLLGALLLNNSVVAQYSGLRPLQSLREALGVGMVCALALIATAALQWPLAHWLLQPAGLPHLRTYTTVLLAAVAAQLVERVLRRHHAQFFPANGHHLPLIIANTILLALVLFMHNTGTGFAVCIGLALLYAAAFLLLPALLQALRERSAGDAVPAPFRGPALEMLNVGLIALAGSGLAGLL